ncbi:MAG: hypothetical protein QUU85_02415, partial [Candidatus Eisenbacteria bacterium]|nr:hypothetical protein [Candidatus Eisenbacteria bacterium]
RCLVGSEMCIRDRDEVREEIRSDTFHIGNVPDRLRRLRKDPWEDIGKLRQSITAPMQRKLLGRG